MKYSERFTTVQLTVLVALRLLIGWHLLYEGIVKQLNANWSSAGFLLESKWILSGFSHWIISHPILLNLVDFLNTWGLIAIGTGLMVGLFTRAASISGALLLFLYYLNNPPLIGLEYSMPAEGHYLVINKTLIEAVALLVVALFPTSKIFGLDQFITRLKISVRNSLKRKPVEYEK